MSLQKNNSIISMVKMSLLPNVVMHGRAVLLCRVRMQLFLYNYSKIEAGAGRVFGAL